MGDRSIASMIVPSNVPADGFLAKTFRLHSDFREQPTSAKMSDVAGKFKKIYNLKHFNYGDISSTMSDVNTARYIKSQPSIEGLEDTIHFAFQSSVLPPTQILTILSAVSDLFQSDISSVNKLPAYSPESKKLNFMFSTAVIVGLEWLRLAAQQNSKEIPDWTDEYYAMREKQQFWLTYQQMSDFWDFMLEVKSHIFSQETKTLTLACHAVKDWASENGLFVAFFDVTFSKNKTLEEIYKAGDFQNLQEYENRWALATGAISSGFDGATANLFTA